MKKYLISLLFIFIVSIGFSQKFKIGFESGIAVYNMKDLKGLTSDVHSSLPFNAKLVSNYPSYLYYNPGIYVSWENFNIGFHTGINSTGSRISSKDYSGEYEFDTRVVSIVPSFYADYKLTSLFEYFAVYFVVKSGAVFSTLKIEEKLDVFDETISDISIDYNAVNYFFEPGLKLEYKLNKFLSFGLNTSYLIQFGNNEFESDDYGILYNNAFPIKPEWNSFRVGLSLFLTIPRAEN
jgi:hypothetical protein